MNVIFAFDNVRVFIRLTRSDVRCKNTRAVFLTKPTKQVAQESHSDEN